MPESLYAGLGLSLNLVVVLYTVQRAASGMITALNIVFDEDEQRGRLRREVVALLIAFGALVLIFASLFLLVVVPLFAPLGPLQPLVLLRWPVLIGLFYVSFALLYRYAACRSLADWRPILLAAGFTTGVWTVASGLFTLYMERVGDWEPYYGSITTPIVLMTWIFISAFVVMVGAELSAQLEQRAHPEMPKEHKKEVFDRTEGL